jgi:hypothetical protein
MTIETAAFVRFTVSIVHSQLCSTSITMHLSRSLFVLAHASSVLASPSYCTRADAALSLLKGPLKTIASNFCQTYLGTRSTTLTATATATGPENTITTTLPDQTQTETTEVTVTDTTTDIDTVNQPNPTVTVTQTRTAGTRTIYQRKRAATERRAATPVPSALRAFAASRISSACSCIVTPSTVTKVVTTLTTVPGKDVTKTEQGNTDTTTETDTEKTTLTVEVTTTVGPAGTDTVEVATTVTPILVKPKICNARGLPGANAFNYDANFNTNQANCIASCKTDNRCLSTGFYIVTDPSTGTQTGTCRKYDKSVTDSADLGPGYYNFNDKAC